MHASFKILVWWRGRYEITKFRVTTKQIALFTHAKLQPTHAKEVEVKHTNKTNLRVYICTHWVFGCRSYNNYQNNLQKFLQRSPAIIGFPNLLQFYFTFTIQFTKIHLPFIYQSNPKPYKDPTTGESIVLQRSNHERIHCLTNNR